MLGPEEQDEVMQAFRVYQGDCLKKIKQGRTDCFMPELIAQDATHLYVRKDSTKGVVIHRTPRRIGQTWNNRMGWRGGKKFKTTVCAPHTRARACVLPSAYLTVGVCAWRVCPRRSGRRRSRRQR